ncbi:neo-calmodulin-like isoform X1 [Micractinium conductrix]|uniref:Neo-calmodulin-like isoform X1 n=1 Tax=Micractinium conductrix TaxID=554055 RepID=A0A2P6VA01_9CHLO|nr:neo-calmodulin-like isoform X1 [Micractinium conductrix]|eukprot:PSC70922.1 neo-calmodulin-like isoform X1 [Micractinium conductrix]
MYATMQARTVVVRHSCPRRAPLRASPTRPRLVVAAQGQQTPPPAGKGDAENRRRQQDELKSSLKKMGIDKGTAQRILTIWKQSGADSPEALRRLFLRRSFSRSQQIGLQLLIDAASGAGAFYAARTITPEQLGTWTLAAKSAMYFISMYLWIGASFEFFSLVALFYAAYRYSTNSDAFLGAVQDIAGPPSGLGVVLQALDQIRDLLQGDASASQSFFDNLGIYLTLERAQRLYGFDAQRYGLSDAAAGDIAAVFARYDSNDDGFISLDEFRRLCAEQGTELSGPEVQAAFDLLDVDKSGALDFGEWVEWFLAKQRKYEWLGGAAPQQVEKAAAAGEGQ